MPESQPQTSPCLLPMFRAAPPRAPTCPSTLLPALPPPSPSRRQAWLAGPSRWPPQTPKLPWEGPWTRPHVERSGSEGETGYGDGDAWGAGDAWGDCEAGSRPEAQRCRAARGELGIGAGDRDCWGDTACLEDVCEAGGLPEAPSCRAPRGELGIGEGDRDSWGDTACLEDVGRREAPCCRDPRGELGDTVRVGLPTSVVE
mmetsp:Transcript_15026/g.52752  ORF Transcript_15026/g.52752 Transcript_15026/m.52752 type:complete len:201 (-) Transcript_15026:199-801(-)